MNDSSVSQVSLKTVLKQPAYLLFYVRDPASIQKHTKINVSLHIIMFFLYIYI